MPGLARASSAPCHLLLGMSTDARSPAETAARSADREVEKPVEELPNDLDISRSLLQDLFKKLEPLPLCGVCMEDNDQLLLECTHCFCKPCLIQQLDSRWPGLRVTFGYLNCGLCREGLANQELEALLTDHLGLRQRVVDIAETKFRNDGQVEKLCSELGRAASSKEIRDRAEA